MARGRARRARARGRARPAAARPGRRAGRRGRARCLARVRALAARCPPVRSEPGLLRAARLTLLERVPRLLRRPASLRSPPPPGHGRSRARGDLRLRPARRARRRSAASDSGLAVAARRGRLARDPARAFARAPRRHCDPAREPRRARRADIPARPARRRTRSRPARSRRLRRRRLAGRRDARRRLLADLGPLHPAAVRGQRLLRLELAVLRPALAEEEDDGARGAGAADGVALLARGRPRRLLQQRLGAGRPAPRRTRSSRRRRACAGTRRSSW